MNTFSIFEGGIKNIKPTKDIDLIELYKLLKSVRYKARVLKYRSTHDKAVKDSLDYVTPSGSFAARNNAGLIKHSGIICIDIDKLDSVDDAETLKLDLMYADIKPCLLFISPSGKGLKMFYFIDIEVGTHSQYFKALETYFNSVLNIQIDKACSDVSRACYLSYDPDIYLNEDAAIVGADFLNQYYVESKAKESPNSSSIQGAACANEAEAMEIMTIAIQKKQKFEEGNRNSFILRLASDFNRVGVSKLTAIDHLLSYAEPDFKPAEIKAAVSQGYKRTDLFNIAPLQLSQTAAEAFADDFIDTVEFPTDGLPNVLLDFAKDISNVYGIPLEFPIMSCLAALSAILKKNVQVDSGKYKNYPQLWAMVVAPSGVGKSEQMDIAFRPIKELDKDGYEAYQTALHFWKDDCTVAKKENQTEPARPFLKQYTVDDATPEALFQTMQRNGGAVTLCRDELSGWFADFGRYAKSGEVARYLSIFNNNQFVINRKGDEPLMITAPFLSIIGGIQPDVLDKALQEGDLINNGFASRFLYVYPDTMEKQQYSESVPDSKLYENYSSLITSLAGIDDYDPFTFAPNAKRLFIDFSNEMTDKVNASTNGFLRASYSKMEIHCLRLALIVELAKQETAAEITANTMQYVISLCRYFCMAVEKVAARQYKKENKGVKKELDKLTVAKYLIDECECSQNEAAKAVKVSQQYISKKLKT